MLVGVQGAGADVADIECADFAFGGDVADIKEVGGSLIDVGLRGFVGEPLLVGLGENTHHGSLIFLYAGKAVVVDVGVGVDVRAIDTTEGIDVCQGGVGRQVGDVFGHHVDEGVTAVGLDRDIGDGATADDGEAAGTGVAVDAFHAELGLADTAGVHGDRTGSGHVHVLDKALGLFGQRVRSREDDFDFAVLHDDVAAAEAVELRGPGAVIGLEGTEVGGEVGSGDGSRAEDFDGGFRTSGQFVAVGEDGHVLNGAASEELRIVIGDERRVGDEVAGSDSRVLRRADSLGADHVAGGVQFGEQVGVRRCIDDVERDGVAFSVGDQIAFSVLLKRRRDPDVAFLGLRIDARDVLSRGGQFDVALFADVGTGRDAGGRDEDIADVGNRDVVQFAIGGFDGDVGIAVLRDCDGSDDGAFLGGQQDVALFSDVFAADDPSALSVDSLLVFGKSRAVGCDGQTVQFAVDAFDLHGVRGGEVTGGDGAVSLDVDILRFDIDGGNLRACGKSCDRGLLGGVDRAVHDAASLGSDDNIIQMGESRQAADVFTCRDYRFASPGADGTVDDVFLSSDFCFATSINR